MKKLGLTLFSALALSVMAQNNDPVIMTINGKEITRGEFEYSYNKNGGIDGAVEQKSVEEYVDMFVNYKLKVIAAEAACMDTLTSFKKEFKQYRDMQLTPYMVDSMFIDSVARSLYQRTLDQLKGQDMLRVAHVLVMLKQDASEQERKQAQQKADSIYALLQGGADFATLAKQHSDDKGSAMRGGELPFIGPGMTLKEFEEAAYSLKVGDISSPVLSPVGYHVIKMLERKQLEPYAQLRQNIIESLKRQNIEEISAEQRIKKMVDSSNGRLTRESVLDSVLNAHVNDNPELKYLIQEYHDGLLLYEISKRDVWDVAANDINGLQQWFKKNKKKYAWKEPRFKGFVFQSKKEGLEKAIKSVLKKNEKGDWRKAIKEQFNKDSLVVRVSGPYLCKKHENAYIDKHVFNEGNPPANTKFPYSGVVGKKVKQPKSYEDVRSLVVNDYQEYLEKQWIDQLRATYRFTINEEVLKTVNKH